MPPVDKQVPIETLEVLLQHKREVLQNISAHYRDELNDANLDSERAFKYGFGTAALVQAAISGLAVAMLRTEDAVLFAAVLLFLSLAALTLMYERTRVEKANLRQNASAEREPIMQQIAVLKGFLEPSGE